MCSVHFKLFYYYYYYYHQQQHHHHHHQHYHYWILTWGEQRSSTHTHTHFQLDSFKVITGWRNLTRTSTSVHKGKAVLLHAWTGPESSRKLRFPDFMTTAQDGGKVVSLTHRPPLPQEMLLVLISVRGPWWPPYIECIILVSKFTILVFFFSYFYVRVYNVKTFLLPFCQIVLLLEQEINAESHRLHVSITVRYGDALSETKAVVKC